MCLKDFCCVLWGCCFKIFFFCLSIRPDGAVRRWEDRLCSGRVFHYCAHVFEFYKAYCSAVEFDSFRGSTVQWIQHCFVRSQLAFRLNYFGCNSAQLQARISSFIPLSCFSGTHFKNPLKMMHSSACMHWSIRLLWEKFNHVSSKTLGNQRSIKQLMYMGCCELSVIWFCFKCQENGQSGFFNWLSHSYVSAALLLVIYLTRFLTGFSHVYMWRKKTSYSIKYHPGSGAEDWRERSLLEAAAKVKQSRVWQKERQNEEK